MGSTSLPMASCAYTVAAPEEMSGKRSPKVCCKAIATATCCATRWPWTRWILAAYISAPLAGRCTRRPMPGTVGPLSSGTFRPCFLWRSRHCLGQTNMIRVMLPQHLRTLAGVRGDVEIEVEGPATLRLVLDAIETRYPMLRGTIRDHVTQQRRPYLRFFACEQDLSHESPDAPLPEAVASGAEPLIILGAIAGG